MGLLDTILGAAVGGGGSPLGRILSSALGGGGGSTGGGEAGGLGGLLGQLTRGGLGDVVSSWVGHGPNQSVEPGQLRDALGHERVQQWSRESGMGENDILSQLSQLLPDAVNRMTPDGRMPEGGGSAAGSPWGGGGGSGGATRGNPFGSAAGSGEERSPFDDAGTELPPR